MKHIAPFAVILALANPLHAEETSFDDLFKQFEKLSEQAQDMMEGWVTEMSPTLEELAEKIGDISAYHPPEILENGDIIIRRKTPKREPDPPKRDKTQTDDKPVIDL